MREKNFIIILIFICLSFSAFLMGYIMTAQDVEWATKGQILSGFTPTPSPIKTTSSNQIKSKLPKAYAVKRGDKSLIMIEDLDSKNTKNILETRLPNPILEWKDEQTIYLKSVKDKEAVTFLLTLDGQLTQVR